jgi:hypothetical protein
MGRLFGFSLFIVTAVIASVSGQDSDKFFNRYGIEVNLVNYPQKSPQDAMKSVSKAIFNGRYEYLLAHLVDPKWVDSRVAEYRNLANPAAELQKEIDDIARETDLKVKKRKILDKEAKDRSRTVVAFNRLVAETKKNLEEDPVMMKELRLFARDAEWEDAGDAATATLKKTTPRRVVFRKSDERWFMDEKNR